jgi:hypothetical protein
MEFNGSKIAVTTGRQKAICNRRNSACKPDIPSCKADPERFPGS